MVLALIAVVVGLLIGLATGGRTAALEEVRPRFWWAPLAAAVLYVIPLLVDDLGGEAVLAAASLAVLVGASLVNLSVGSIGVVAFGLCLNLVPLAIDGATMVGPDAAATVGLDTDEDLGVARRLEITEDRVGLLGDRIPIPGLDWLVSFGDLIIYVGLVDVGLRLTRSRDPQRPAPPAPPVGAERPSGADAPDPWFALVRGDETDERPVAPPRPEPVPVPETSGEIRLADAEPADDAVVPFVDASPGRADELDLSLVRWADEPTPDEARTDELDLRDLQSLLEARDARAEAPPTPEATGPIPNPVPPEASGPAPRDDFDTALARFDREHDVDLDEGTGDRRPE